VHVLVYALTLHSWFKWSKLDNSFIFWISCEVLGHKPKHAPLGVKRTKFVKPWATVLNPVHFKVLGICHTLSGCLCNYSLKLWLSFDYLQRVRYIFIPSNERDYVMMSAAIQGLTVTSGHDKGDWWVERVTYVKPTLRRVVHLNSMIQWCVEVLWAKKAQWSCAYAGE
jgi:hypothetical protein